MMMTPLGQWDLSGWCSHNMVIGPYARDAAGMGYGVFIVSQATSAQIS